MGGHFRRQHQWTMMRGLTIALSMFALLGCGETPETSGGANEEIAPDSAQVSPGVEIEQDNQPIAQAEATSATRPPEPSICPDPSDCIDLGEISVGHGQPGLTLQLNPDANDAIAKLGQTIGEIAQCVERLKKMTDCVAESSAPQACKKAFSERVVEVGEPRAFAQIFLDPDGSCIVSDGERAR